MRKLGVVMLAALALSLVGCGGDGGSSSDAPTTTLEEYTITGRFLLLGSAANDDFVEYERTSGPGVACAGYGGYGDVKPGLQVTVEDEKGTIIGDGALSEGSSVADGCSFDFKVPDLPRANFYKIEVGRRGNVNYKYDAIKAAGWNVTLTLG
jgi:hypothetical protein